MISLSAGNQVNVLRAWAARELSVSPDATPGRGQDDSGFCRGSDQADFLPPDSWYQAVSLLDESIFLPKTSAKSLEQSRKKTQADAERAELDEFTCRFWDLEPQARRFLWKKLRDKYSESYPFQSRLQMLECGLDLNIKPSLFEAQSAPTTIRANVVEMATSIMQVFLLAPSVRAVRRRELMRKIARKELWQASARHLVEYHPSIALLEDLRSFLRVLAEATRRRNFENRTQMLTPLHELQSLREAPVPIWRLAAGILTVILMWLVAMVFIA